MTFTAIILSHYKEREGNLKRIVDDLLGGSVVPDSLIVFIDNPDIVFEDNRVTVIRSSKSFLPIIRFALGSICDTEYCFFLDDDMTVQKRTLENFIQWATINPSSILGLEGSKLGNTETPYSNDTSIKRGNSLIAVDIIIRSYFVPTNVLVHGLRIRSLYPEFPKTSLDDVFICLGNKYLGKNTNYVIPVDGEADVIELPEGGVGQSLREDHYKNRNIVCRKLMDMYE